MQQQHVDASLCGHEIINHSNAASLTASLHQLFRIFCITLCVTLCLTLSAPSAFAKAQIRLINLDSIGEGLNDTEPATPVGGNLGTTLGEQRLNALRYAADILETILASDVTIEIGVSFNPQGGSFFAAPLAAAGPNTYHFNFEGAIATDVWHVQALANKLFGADLAEAGQCIVVSDCYDVAAIFNSSIDSPTVLGDSSWYYGYDGPTAAATNEGNDFDLITVALHEWLHGIGFISFVDFATGGFIPTQEGQELPDLYSSLIRLQDGSPTGFSDMNSAQRLTAMRSEGRLQWTGTRTNQVAATTATAGVQDGHVQLHSPDPIEVGASVSHIAANYSPDQTMEPYYTRADHDPGIAAAFLADLGWGNYTDLAINFAAGANPASDTDTTQYYIAVSNRGSDIANSTFVDYTLPNDTTLVSATLTDSSGATSTITCTSAENNLITCGIGNLVAGITQILTLTLQHGSPGAITHAGSVYGDIVDGTPTNNAFSSTAVVSSSAQTLVAEAGPATQVISGNSTQLDGTGSTSTDSAISQYVFEQLAGTTVQLEELTPGVMRFVAPSGTEDLLFRLTVTAENSATSADFALITLNNPPTANAGENQSVLINTSVSLSGSNSTDSDGSIASYSWQQTSGPSVSLSDASTANPTFTAPRDAFTLNFTLTVTDNEGATATAATTVSVVTSFQSTDSAGSGTGGDSDGGSTTGSGSGSGGGGGGHLNWLALFGLALLFTAKVCQVTSTLKK